MTRMISLPVAVLALVLAPPASGMQASSLRVLETSGCYRIELARWSIPFAPGTVQELIPPSDFQLDTSPLKEPFDRASWRQALPVKLSASGHEMRSGWRFVGSDSVQVVWSTGVSGVSFRLRLQSDTLIGVASSRSAMYGAPARTASAKAIKVKCAGQ
jgi:hypothetical protein